MTSVEKPLSLPEPWLALDAVEDADMIEVCERELAAEVAPDHILYDRHVSAVAKCQICDDALYRLSDGLFAYVHLTWSHTRDRPPRPQAEILQDEADTVRSAELHVHDHH